MPPPVRRFVARWNDGRFVSGISDDPAFARTQTDLLATNLASTDRQRVVVATHVCPHEDLLPRVPDGPVPPDKLRYAFARAYLGSPALGRVALADPRVCDLICGHSHVPRRHTAGHVRLCNVGSTYDEKHFHVVEL